MHCLVRDCRLESDKGGQKNGQIYKNRNSTASLVRQAKLDASCRVQVPVG
ncbi:hypothetical protein [Pseudoalteromonas tunicata]|uniref:Uncharacterized protein n=1 Tax=Pseudoalteromonas tunicata D2 TaxID=87626 RepID=A4C415_9GAMM|nr:hypothetical protein [Pseudoalteromonas tunicata]ATC97221.1 hypothetical protein PTUN_b0900 [Pseudoalteromonas tunicata]EAR30297.1 hypothetical protein PTD2_01971 [Pseudoalteromonas tunicata D2]